MRRLLAFLLAFAALAWCAPAFAAITPTDIGSANGGSSTITTLAITTSAPSAAGNAIIGVINTGTTATSLTVIDSASNSYTVEAAYSTGGTAGKLWLFYSPNAAALGSGGTITANWTGAAKAGMGAISVSGLATSSIRDVLGAGSTATGTSSTISTGTLAQGDELVIGRVDTAASTGTFTQASGFTALATITVAAGNQVVNWAYHISTADTSSVTYAPSWVTSRVYGTNIYSFKAPSTATAATRSLLGVGN